MRRTPWDDIIGGSCPMSTLYSFPLTFLLSYRADIGQPLADQPDRQRFSNSHRSNSLEKVAGILFL